VHILSSTAAPSVYTARIYECKGRTEFQLSQGKQQHVLLHQKYSTRSDVQFNVKIYYDILGRGSPDPTLNENNENLKLFNTLMFKATRCIYTQKTMGIF